MLIFEIVIVYPLAGNTLTTSQVSAVSGLSTTEALMKSVSINELASTIEEPR